MQLQSKKNTLAVLLVGWLVVLGSYLIIRFVFILIGFTLNPTILGISPCGDTVSFGDAVSWKMRQIAKNIGLCAGVTYSIHR